MAQTQSLEERIDRLESAEALRQLASRYAFAVDTRNLDDLVALFVEDVRVGRDSSGREALKEWFGGILSGFRTSVHLVGNHVIDFEDADHARGVVYCHDERHVGDEWMMGQLQYWDTYQRRDGKWYFLRRRPMSWYAADVLTRPNEALAAGQGGVGSAMTVGALPDAWPSWEKFWKSRE